MAEALAELGANLVLCARKVERCEQAASEFEQLGVKALGLACDVREQEKVPLITPGEEKRAEKILQDVCLRQLSSLVLEPIRAQVGGKKRWVISPDGPLWTIPWAALLLPDDRYAIDELAIRYAVSGRDLVRPASLAARRNAVSFPPRSMLAWFTIRPCVIYSRERRTNAL